MAKIDATSLTAPAYSSRFLAVPLSPTVVARRDGPMPTMHLIDSRTSRDVESRWRELVDCSPHPFAFFCTPGWVECTALAEKPGSVSVVGFCERNDDIVGVAAFVRCERALRFNIGPCVLARRRLRCVHLLGSSVLMADDVGLHDKAFAAIADQYSDVDAIEIDRVIVGEFLWKYLWSSEKLQRHFLPYLPDGREGALIAHSISLPETFAEYCQNFRPKWQRELRRQRRRLAEASHGAVYLQKYERPEEVADFLSSSAIVVRNSWQCAAGADTLLDNDNWRRKLACLADAGSLGAYILFAGDRPCAVELGFQHRNVFHAMYTYYDRDLAEFSPGTMLLLDFIEDLIDCRRVRVLCFGHGDVGYKRLFGNSVCQEASVILIRRTRTNVLLRSLHNAFRSSIRRVKEWRAPKSRELEVHGRGPRRERGLQEQMDGIST